MTNEPTVPVPVELLKELKSSYRGSSREIEARWDEVTTTLEGTAYDRVVALIPTPPKVGDVADADNWRALPAGTVLRDSVGDLWFVGPGETLSYLNPSRSRPQAFELTDPGWDVYAPIIISLPKESK